MEASVIETVAKYFYFSCLDEQISFTASLKALTDLKNRGALDKDARSVWIEVLNKWKPRLRSLRGGHWKHKPGESGFSFPADLHIDAWVNFLTSGESSEVEAVLLSKILGFRDDEIAEGLGVTPGTVRYRVGRGLRHLGGFLES